VVAVSAVEEAPPVATEAGVLPTKERLPPVPPLVEAGPPVPGAGRRAPARQSTLGVQHALAGRRVPKERTPAS